MRLVFLGSPPFATPILRRLLDSHDRAGLPTHQVAALVTPPDRPRGRGRSIERSPLALLGDAAGIPVIQPTTTKTPDFVETLAAFSPDVLAVASYGEILRTPVLDLCPHGALNVHGSLLPRWRGASPIQRAIAAGDTETGVSIQRMVLALDAGDVILKKTLPIAPTDTAADLFDRLATLGADALLEALDAIEQGTATYTPQDPTLVTLAPKLKKEDGHVHFHAPADAVCRHIRAMTTWPGARCFLPDGRPMVILECKVDPDGPPAAPPGTRVDRGDRFVVATGDGTAVELLKVKPAGKGAMAGSAFLRGAQLEVGAELRSDPV